MIWRGASCRRIGRMKRSQNWCTSGFSKSVQVVERGVVFGEFRRPADTLNEAPRACAAKFFVEARIYSEARAFSGQPTDRRLRPAIGIAEPRLAHGRVEIHDVGPVAHETRIPAQG